MGKREVEWLKQNKIIPIAQQHVECYKKILVNCLRLTNQKVLILGDYGFEGKRISPIISSAYYLAARDLGMDANLIFEHPKTKGEVAELEIITALEGLGEGNAVIMNMTNRMGSLRGISKSFRAFAREREHRFISTSSLELPTSYLKYFIASTDIDYIALQETGQRIKEALDDGNEVHCTTEAGTDLYYDIKGHEAVSADGRYGGPGMGGNLPSGEVYVPCRGKRVNGRIVIDGSTRNRFSTIVIGKNPITLDIEDGKVVNIEGGEEAKLLEASYEWAEKRAKYPWGIRRVGEFGIGINPKAELIGSMVLDEKVIGTAHIATGSNYWFGGSIYAIIHLDQVFKNPKIFIDDNEITV